MLAVHKNHPAQLNNLHAVAYHTADVSLGLMLSVSGFKFVGHHGSIAGIAVSPDGTMAVSGAHNPQSADEAILWNFPSGAVHCRLHGSKAGVFSVAYSPDGKIIATGGGGSVQGSRWLYDHAIRLWNDRGDEMCRFGEELFFVYALAFSPDSRILLSGGGLHPKSNGSCLRLWDVNQGREIRRLGSHSSPVSSAAFSPDGKFISAGSSGIQAGGFVPRGDALTASTSETRTIRVWETSSWQELNLFSHQGWVNSVAFSADGKQLLSAGKGTFLWNLGSGAQYQRIGGTETDFTHCAIFSPDGRKIALGTGGRSEMGSPYQNCCARLYDHGTGVEIACWRHEYPVKALAFSPDSRLLLAGGERGELRLWEVP
jgi:WD40 repeat protein